jgi:hypothetical protein
MNGASKCILIAVSIVVAVNVCVATGLITNWGEWYSPSLAFRHQTDALLSGRLALSDSPADAHFDLVWSEGGVHQPWGLGVPLYRIAFELLARTFGQSAFPDRLAFTVALGLITYMFLHVLADFPAEVRNGGRASNIAFRCAATWTVVFFPPFLTLLRVPFNVYEEASAYGYVFGVGLFAGLLYFLAKRSIPRYVMLSLLCAVAVWIRPPALAYGLATFAMAFVVSRSNGWTWGKSLVGVALFGIVSLGLLYTNWVRYGGPFEFGYAYQLNLMYESRVDAPYTREPLGSAARELLGSLFFVKRLNGLDFYGSEIVNWQSSTPRWRNFYSSTFDVTYVVGVLLCWLAALWNQRKLSTSPGRYLSIAAIWSFLSMIPLATFYLRCEVMSSRYTIDFGPAIAVALTGLLWYIQSLGRIGRMSVRFSAVVVLFGVWWLYQVVTAETFASSVPAVTHDEATRPQLGSASYGPVPNTYRAEKNPPAFGIPANRDGWRLADGRTAPIALVFFDMPGAIVLEVQAAAGLQVHDEDFRQIKVRIGPEWLRLETFESRGATKMLTFAPPQDATLRQGIQLLILSFAQTHNFAQPLSNFCLMRLTNIPTALPGNAEEPEG